MILVKRLFSFAFVAFVIIASCASHVAPQAPPSVCDGEGGVCRAVDAGATSEGNAAEVGTPATPVTVTADNWEFTLPDDGWTVSTIDDVSVRINKARHNMLIFVKEPFKGNAMQYALLAVKAVRDNGGKLISAKNIRIDNRVWLVLQYASPNNEVMIWNWIGFTPGFGYTLQCGGPVDDDSQLGLCNQIGSTLKITQ